MTARREAALEARIIELEKRLTLLEARQNLLEFGLGGSASLPKISVGSDGSLKQAFLDSREAVLEYARVQLGGFLSDIVDAAERAHVLAQSPTAVLAELTAHIVKDEEATSEIRQMAHELSDAAAKHGVTWEELGIR